MKKVLFATTALIASAGIASAQGVEVSGFAELGIFDPDTADSNVQFHTDIDVTFTMSGETDAGLTFGASIDLDESDGDGQFNSPAFDADTEGGESIFISGTFGTLTMGDTDGAFDRAMTEAIIGGSIQDDHEHEGYNGNAGLDGTYDGQVARYDYSFGDFGFSVSGEVADSGDGDPVLGLGVTYAAALGGVDLGFGLGYQTVDTGAIDGDIIGVSVDASFAGGFQAIFNYSTADVDVFAEDPEHFGIALGYSVDALTVAVNYGDYSDWELRTDPGDADSSGLGLIVNYDLGGGAEIQFGVGDNDRDEADGGVDTTTYSLGLALSF
ncbi:MAG: porin [Pseudomonadota bacterium]